MAVNWKTGALKWFFQATHHDWLDFDLPHPPMVLRVPIDGKMVPVLAEGSKGGFFYVLNAKNGGPVPHFKITETPTYDPSGNGIALNSLCKTQPFPNGASFCMAVVDYSPAGLGEVQLPGQPADRRVRARVGNRSTARPRSPTWPTASRSSVRRRAAAHDYGSYLVYGGAGGGGIFGYPPSAYSPQTHTYYACLQNDSGAHTNPARTPRTCRPSAPR